MTFKDTRAAAAVASAQAIKSVVPGLQLVSLQGEYHTVTVGAPAASGLASTAAAPKAQALPADAIFRFKITDDSQVQAKIAELKANPGALKCQGATSAGAAVGLAGLRSARCACPPLPCTLFHAPGPALHVCLPPHHCGCPGSPCTLAPPHLLQLSSTPSLTTFGASTQWTPDDPLYAPSDYYTGQWAHRQVWSEVAWDTAVGNKEVRGSLVGLVDAVRAARGEGSAAAHDTCERRGAQCPLAAHSPPRLARTLPPLPCTDQGLRD